MHTEKTLSIDKLLHICICKRKQPYAPVFTDKLCDHVRFRFSIPLALSLFRGSLSVVYSALRLNTRGILARWSRACGLRFCEKKRKKASSYRLGLIVEPLDSAELYHLVLLRCMHNARSCGCTNTAQHGESVCVHIFVFCSNNYFDIFCFPEGCVWKRSKNYKWDRFHAQTTGKELLWSALAFVYVCAYVQMCSC